MTDARQNIVMDLQTALLEYVQQTINNFIGTHGMITMISTNHIEFMVNSTSMLDLFQVFPLISSIPLPTILVEHVAYTFDTSELAVDTRGYGSQTIIPSVLILQNVNFSFIVCLSDVTTLVVYFNGDVLLGGATVTVSAIYTHSSGKIVVGAMVSGLDINF